MKKLIHSALAVAIGLSLTACGSSSSDKEEPPVPTTLEISGQAVKGTLANALVEVFNVNDLETPVGSDAQTDDAGNYTVTITDESGAPIVGSFVVKVSADDDTTMVCDALICGDLVKGDKFQAADLTGLSLLSYVYSNDSDSAVANVNALTTMATETVLAAAEANENIDLSALEQEHVTNLQVSASELVGTLIGVDLSETNVYDVAIVDASVSEDIPTDDAKAATLSFFNAALTGLDESGAADGAAVSHYASAPFTVSLSRYLNSIVVVVNDAIRGNELSQQSFGNILSAQSQLAQIVTDIQVNTEMNTGVKIPTLVISSGINEEDIIQVGSGVGTTGGTGGTTP